MHSMKETERYLHKFSFPSDEWPVVSCKSTFVGIESTFRQEDCDPSTHRVFLLFCLFSMSQNINSIFEEAKQKQMLSNKELRPKEKEVTMKMKES